MTELSSLALRGTPVSDDLAVTVARRFNLQYLDLVAINTTVTTAGLAQLSTEHPHLKIYPRSLADHPTLGGRSAHDGLAVVVV